MRASTVVATLSWLSFLSTAAIAGYMAHSVCLGVAVFVMAMASNFLGFVLARVQ